MTSIYKISEQIIQRTGSGDHQAVIAAVIDSYSSACRREWYEGKADGIDEIAGSAIYTFGKTTPLIPVLDTFTNEYYITMPSSVLNLPAQRGIVWVSYPQDKVDFVLVNGLWNPSLKAFGLGGRQTYRPEETKMYFPKMEAGDVGNILLKLAVALDNVDVDEELNIPRAMIDSIVDIVVQKFAPKPKEDTKVNV